tara:strand:- start:13 stop:384 length:372 start_codon:yes stop_codon:yes gene_type:complete
MTFFVSDSLKGIITEKDLEAVSPIKIIEEESLNICFCNGGIEGFSCELILMNFCEAHDEIEIMTSQTTLARLFDCVNKKVDYSISLNGIQYLENSGKLVLNKLELNKEENYVTCKIDIFKRSN